MFLFSSNDSKVHRPIISSKESFYFEHGNGSNLLSPSESAPGSYVVALRKYVGSSEHNLDEFYVIRSNT